MLALSWFYASTILNEHRPRIREVLLFSIITVSVGGLFSLITFFRVGGRASLLDVTVLHFYGTIMVNLPLASWFVDHPFPQRLPGQNTFHGIYVVLDGLWAFFTGGSFLGPIPPQLADIVNVGIFNTTSYLAYIYSDFGVVGVVLSGLLFGAISTMAFVRCLVLRRVTDVEALALFTVGIIMSVRGVFLGVAGFWVTLLGIYLQPKRVVLGISMKSRKPIV